MAAYRYTHILSKYTSTLGDYLPIHFLLTSLSRRLDPVFAIVVGSAAAVLRVRRDEETKGQSAQQTLDTLKRRLNLAWNGAESKSWAERGA
jgi:hypothetical protein